MCQLLFDYGALPFVGDNGCQNVEDICENEEIVELFRSKETTKKIIRIINVVYNHLIAEDGNQKFAKNLMHLCQVHLCQVHLCLVHLCLVHLAKVSSDEAGESQGRTVCGKNPHIKIMAPKSS